MFRACTYPVSAHPIISWFMHSHAFSGLTCCYVFQTGGKDSNGQPDRDYVTEAVQYFKNKLKWVPYIPLQHLGLANLNEWASSFLKIQWFISVWNQQKELFFQFMIYVSFPRHFDKVYDNFAISKAWLEVFLSIFIEMWPNESTFI